MTSKSPNPYNNDTISISDESPGFRSDPEVVYTGPSQEYRNFYLYNKDRTKTYYLSGNIENPKGYIQVKSEKFDRNLLYIPFEDVFSTLGVNITYQIDDQAQEILIKINS